MNRIASICIAALLGLASVGPVAAAKDGDIDTVVAVVAFELVCKEKPSADAFKGASFYAELNGVTRQEIESRLAFVVATAADHPDQAQVLLCLPMRKIVYNMEEAGRALATQGGKYK